MMFRGKQGRCEKGSLNQVKLTLNHAAKRFTHPVRQRIASHDHADSCLEMTAVASFLIAQVE